MRNRTLKILITVALIGGGVGYLMFSSVAGAVSYYKHVDEVMAEPERWVGKSMQVHGYVKPGTLTEKIIGQSTHRTFVLHNNHQTIFVKNTGPKPDTFKERAEVVAKGKIVEENGQYILYADELVAKCPSKYEEERRNSTFGSN